MKISPLTSIKISKTNTNIQNNKNSFKFKANKDSFEKSNTEAPIQTLNFIKNSNLRKEIIDNLLTSERGGHLDDVENTFITVVETCQMAYANKNIKLDNKQFENLIKAIYLVLYAQKQNDEVEVDYRQLNSVFNLIKDDLLEKDDFVFDAIKYSNSQNGTDPNMLSALLLCHKMFGNQKNACELKSLINYYCLDENGKISKEKFPALIFLMFATWASDFEQFEEYRKHVIDEDGSINPEKYNFVFEYAKTIGSDIMREFSTDEISQNLGFIMEIKKQILNKLVENSKEGNDYDPQKALESFKNWYNYISENKDFINSSIPLNYYDHGKRKKIPLARAINNPKMRFISNTPKYDTKLYRLYQVLLGESLFKG